ncbi:MAG: CerR family C-terminal domain-containing protein [bacterium]|jgi:AcrR family transcriptional regulator|nr:CerR family C-terminal domain-containing protein [Betaproteobacteria bacterium]
MAVPAAGSRSDGAQARDRLLHAALRLFAARGFERTSIREIAQAADANISAIGYYFGDKAGLYRAAFTEPMGDACPAARMPPGTLPLPDLMRRFFAEFLQPLKQGEAVQLVMRLHFREIVEPTGLWAEMIEHEIKPQHEWLLHLLAGEFGLAKPDADLQRLTFSIVGMAIHFFVGQDIVHGIAPEVMDGPDAIDLLAERLAGYSLAMIEAERQRRAATAHAAPRRSTRSRSRR